MRLNGCSAGIFLLQVNDTFLNQLTKDVQLDFFQFPDIQTPFSCFEPTQPGQVFLLVGKSRHDVQGQALFSGSQPGQEPVTFPARRIYIEIVAISDNGTALHDWFLMGDLLHDRLEGLTILSSLHMFNR